MGSWGKEESGVVGVLARGWRRPPIRPSCFVPPSGKRPRKWTFRGPNAVGRGPPPPVWGVQTDAPGQWRGQLPSSVWIRHGAVKQ